MLDHYLNNFVHNCRSLIIFADNCAGQNKNQYFIGYLSYLTKVLKKYDDIELYFMVSGHTKFSPDSHFGTIKKKLRHSVCQSILDLCGDKGIVRQSAQNNQTIVYKDPITLDYNFKWRDWKKFLSHKFLSCQGIKEWHAIKIRDDGSCNILVAPYVGLPYSEHKILKGELLIEVDDIPKIIEPDKLTENRLGELKYFEKFVDPIHKSFISSPY